MFFSVDATTGSPRAQITPGNLRLFHTLLGRPHSLQIKLVCARFAVDVRDLQTARRLCEAVLAEPYRWFSERKLTAQVHTTDTPLWFAHEQAIQILFYGVRDEGAFRLINEIKDRGALSLNVATLPNAPPKPGSPDDPGWQSYPRARREVMLCQTLVQTIRQRAEGK